MYAILKLNTEIKWWSKVGMTVQQSKQTRIARMTTDHVLIKRKIQFTQGNSKIVVVLNNAH